MRHRRHWTVSASVVLCMGVMYGARGACDDNRNNGQSDARFVAQDDVVHDKSANLIWKRCSEGQVWSADAGGCQGKPRTFNCEQAGVTETHGWRVPTVDELERLVAKGCRSPSIDESIFPGTPAGPYWTSSKLDGGCWRVEFEYGGAYLSNWWDPYHLRLVRNADVEGR